MLFIGQRLYSLDRKIEGTIRQIKSQEYGIIEVLYDDNSHETSNIGRYKIMESKPNYFKLLREITRYDDNKITDAQAFAFIVEELASKKQYKNEQPLLQDNFKEKELWEEVLRLFERLSNFTGHNKMHQFDLAREEAKFLDQVEKFRNTLQKTFI